LTPPTYLPEKGTPEADKIIAAMKTGNRAEYRRICRRYGYGRLDSFYKAVRARYNINIVMPPVKPIEEPEPAEKEEETVVVNLPPVNITPYQPKKGKRGDPEIQGLLLADHHAGEITATYNEDVYRQRMQRILESTLTITELHRQMYDVDELVILALGDMVHGENPKQGAKVGSIDKGAMDQVYDIALPAFNDLLCNFRQQFKSVKLYGVPGNHGRISKEAPDTSNYDLALYRTLQREKLPDGIDIHTPDDWYQLVDINGYRFFAYHGDQIRMSNGIPYFAMSRKVQSWYINFGGFSYACQGHFHKDDYFRVTGKTKLFCCGPLVTDDSWALGTVGTSTIPSQTTFGVHPRHGVTWHYNLVLDDAFLPDKAPEKKGD